MTGFSLHTERLGILALGMLWLPAIGCTGEDTSPQPSAIATLQSMEEDPQSMAHKVIKIQVSGTARAPDKFQGGQARLAAQRAAKVIALRKAEKRIVESGGTTPVQSFRVLETITNKDGSVEVVLEVLGLLGPGGN